MPLTDRQKKIISGAKDAARTPISVANEVELTEIANAAMRQCTDGTTPLSDRDAELFIATYAAEHTRYQVSFPVNDLLPEFSFTEAPINVFGDAHRYQVRVVDLFNDGQPIFFISESYNDQRHPHVVYERVIKLTLQSWKDIDTWLRARQRRAARALERK